MRWGVGWAPRVTEEPARGRGKAQGRLEEEQPGRVTGGKGLPLPEGTLRTGQRVWAREQPR